MLVDTSVWIDHFRRSDAALVAALDRGDVHCHEFVIGELACGTLPRRDEVLALIRTLPRVPVAVHEETMTLVAERRLWSRGLGWVDVSLLAAAVIAGVRLWTRDRRLHAVVRDLGLAWEPSPAS
jgi:predicted nucleic acid-binding protein